MKCDDCGGPIGRDKGPPDGWQLEDGRTVCHTCCVADVGRCVEAIKAVSMYSDDIVCGECGYDLEDCECPCEWCGNPEYECVCDDEW